MALGGKQTRWGGELPAQSSGRRVWRIPIYLGFGGVVVTIEPWTWRGVRRRLFARMRSGLHVEEVVSK